MAEWSQLPGELLHLISTHLPSEIDLLRFRSVCSSWRCSASSSPTSSPSRFPILPNAGISDTTWGFYLSKRPLYSLAANTNNPQKGWIIKLEKDSSDRANLLNPLTTRYHPQLPLPRNFPGVLDFMNLRVRELGCEYTLQYINYRPLATNIGDSGNLYMEKVAFCGEGEGSFVILTIHVSGKLVLYKSGDKRWTMINDLVLLSPYDDVISHFGKFYAVDNNGRLVMVNLNNAELTGPANINVGGSRAGLMEPPSLSLVADSVHGGDKKFLVEDGGDLLMVDKYLGIGAVDDLGYYNEEGFDFDEEFDCFTSESTLRFKVFRLDRSGRRWVEVSNLGSKIVFLGDSCTFSNDLSELDFGGCCRGNCILFTDQFFGSREDDGVGKSRGIGVFDLETGNISPISSFPGYSELFWPPPSWVYPNSSSSSVEGQLEQLDIKCC